jgi:hypothetical protein
MQRSGNVVLEMVENEIKYFVKRLVFDTSKNLRK